MAYLSLYSGLLVGKMYTFFVSLHEIMWCSHVFYLIFCYRTCMGQYFTQLPCFIPIYML